MAELTERFWSKVEVPADRAECWIWRGATARSGYGVFGLTDGTARAHRVAWWLAYGVYPPRDSVVMHHCDARACVNPRHLKLSTQWDNMRDMTAKGRRQNGSHPATHCRKGLHEFTDENSAFAAGVRYCRACRKERVRRTRPSRAKPK